MVHFTTSSIAAIWARRAFEATRRFAKTVWLVARWYYVDTDKAHFETEMAEAFSKAKPVSDFLGMLVRLTFAMAFVRYCFATSNAPMSYWRQVLRQSAGGVGIVITGYFGFQIARVILAYFARDFAVQRTGWIRAIMVVVSLFWYLAVTATILDLVESLAKIAKSGP